MLNYFSPVKLNNDIIMSCDMLRLSFNLPFGSGDKKYNYMYQFEKWLNMEELKGSFNCKVFESYATFQYRRLYNISYFVNEKEYSFALGLGFNGLSSSSSSTCFIEFNPNKTIDKVSYILEKLKSYTDFDVVRFDIAFDIPLPRELFNLVKDRRNYKKIYSLIQNNKQLDDFTEYLGKRQNNGYIKLYNKQIESNLEKPLTRLELTLDELNYNNLIKEMPILKIFSKECRNLDKLNDTEKCLLTLLLQNDNCMSYFSSLGRYMREKLEPYICSSFDIDITEDNFYHFINLINNIIN